MKFPLRSLTISILHHILIRWSCDEGRGGMGEALQLMSKMKTTNNIISIGCIDEKKILVKPTIRWRYKVKIYTKEKWWKDMDLIHLARDRNLRPAVVNTKMNLHTPNVSIYLSTALHPFCWTSTFFSFLIFYTLSKTPWTGDQPVAWPRPDRTGQHKHSINTHRHPCLIVNPQLQRLCGRRQFMP
jgi:hypothetical protein